MGLFEGYPWLLIPLVIVTVEGWAALKRLFRHVAVQRRLFSAQHLRHARALDRDAEDG